MTVTDPRGEPSLLATIIHNEHVRLEQLLDEAAKQTVTPGVNEEMTEQLRRHFAAHLRAEETIVHPAVEQALSGEETERLRTDATAVRDALTGDPAELGRLTDLLRDHVQVSDEMVGRLHEAVGGRRMATLGFEYGPAAEAAPKRID